MSAAVIEKEAGIARLRLLVVDDDAEVFVRIREALGIRSGLGLFDCVYRESLDAVQVLPSQPPFDVCILDVKFADDLLQISELLDRVKQRWPEAYVIVLSNYPGDLGVADRKRVNKILNKAQFKGRPALLRNAVSHAVELLPKLEADFVSRVTAQMRALEDEVEDPLQKGRGKEVFRARGHVMGVIPPFVEVSIAEPTTDGFIQRTLRMPYNIFRVNGILETGAPFVFRIRSLDDHRFIVEVLPDDDERTVIGGAKMPSRLSALASRRKKQREATLKKHGKAS